MFKLFVRVVSPAYSQRVAAGRGLNSVPTLASGNSSQYSSLQHFTWHAIHGARLTLHVQRIRFDRPLSSLTVRHDTRTKALKE
jgi:hypothetical protein